MKSKIKFDANSQYWYQKGIEDISEFFVNTQPEESQNLIRNLLSGVKKILMRNFELIKQLDEKIDEL